jgi:hypothetical protein
MVKKYNTELTCLCNEHNMFSCIDVFFQLTLHLTSNDFLMLMNAWDIKFKEYMLHSKGHISRYMMGHIEWSPAIGIWLN